MCISYDDLIPVSKPKHCLRKCFVMTSVINQGFLDAKQSAIMRLLSSLKNIGSAILILL